MNLPPIGFGTSPFRAGSIIDVEPLVRTALAAGYRMFDTAEAYGNESVVGRALRTVPRNEIHIIGKVWPTNFAPEHLRPACEASLRRLGIDAFDLYLLHSHGAQKHIAPLDDAAKLGWDELIRRGTSTPADVPLRETWEAMLGLVSAGLAKAVGVSNFTPDQIGDLEPAANEMPCWPHDQSVLDWHRERGIDILGYSPLAGHHDPRSAIVVLRTLISRGIRPITFSTNPDHIRENISALDADGAEFA
jgi:diketogulonate reductase-like aldo/keto reductase